MYLGCVFVFGVCICIWAVYFYLGCVFLFVWQTGLWSLDELDGLCICIWDVFFIFMDSGLSLDELDAASL